MKHKVGLVGACLLGVLLVAAVCAGLRPPARAAEKAATAANALTVVINEVAWMGTQSSDWDEWIELYNNTTNTVALNGWRIAFADGAPSTITLSGSIGPHGYFMLERTEDVITDVQADLIHGGNRMSNISETIRLLDGSGSLVDSVNTDGGNWPAGTNGPDYTMERITSTDPDTDGNWATNNGVIRNGIDASGNPISGTPKCRNSAASAAADLVVEFSSVPAQVNAGERFTYTIRFRNAGNITATTTWVTNTLPTGLTFFTQTSPFTFTIPSTLTLVWEVGNLPISTTMSVITAVVDVDNSASGTMTDTVTVTTAVTDTPTANNTASAIITVQESPPLTTDLSIAKTGPLTATPGSLVTYTIALSLFSAHFQLNREPSSSV